MKVRTMALAATVVLGTMALGGTSLAATSHARPSTTFNVSITEFMFTPKNVQVHVGDTVTWTNNGGVTHTSSAQFGVWNSGNMAPGATFSKTFTATGTFKYRCNIHHQMQGGIRVVP